MLRDRAVQGKPVGCFCSVCTIHSDQASGLQWLQRLQWPQHPSVLWSVSAGSTARLDSPHPHLTHLTTFAESIFSLSRLSRAAVRLSSLVSLSRQALNGEWSFGSSLTPPHSSILTIFACSLQPAACSLLCFYQFRSHHKSTIRNDPQPTVRDDPQPTIIRDCASKMTTPEPHCASTF